MTTARHAPIRSTTIFATSLIACENGTDSLLLSLTLVKLPRNNVCSLLSWASLCLVPSEHISHLPQGARALAIRAALFGISIAIHLATAMLDSLVVSRNQSPRRFLAISSGLACLPPHSVQPYSIDIVNRGIMPILASATVVAVSHAGLPVAITYTRHRYTASAAAATSLPSSTDAWHWRRFR